MGISERWDNFKWPNIEVIGVSEGKEDRKNNGQKLSKLDETKNPDPKSSTKPKHRKYDQNYSETYHNQITQNQ